MEWEIKMTKYEWVRWFCYRCQKEINEPGKNEKDWARAEMCNGCYRDFKKFIKEKR